jgi:hypothetical protein
MEFNQLASGRGTQKPYTMHKVLMMQITAFLPSVEELAL